MSLINDALKRAAEAQKQNPSDSPPAVRLQPVDYSARSSPFLRIVVLSLLLGFVAGSAWFFSKWWHASNQTASTAALTNAPVASVPQTAVEAHPSAGQPGSQSTVRVITNIVVRGGQAAQPAPSATGRPNARAQVPPPPKGTPPETAPPKPPSFPDLKLQSIIYRLSKPAVVINGEMLSVGDVIKGARVVNIERYNVTVEWQGEKRELSLPRL